MIDALNMELEPSFGLKLPGLISSKNSSEKKYCAVAHCAAQLSTLLVSELRSTVRRPAAPKPTPTLSAAFWRKERHGATATGAPSTGIPRHEQVSSVSVRQFEMMNRWNNDYRYVLNVEG